MAYSRSRRPLRLDDLPPDRPQRPRPARRSASGCGTTSATTCPFERQRAILRRAFDLGVTHFDLANNYGPPYGSAETNFGRHLRRGLRALPRRAGHLHQGRLRHVAGPVRQGGGSPQVPARQPRPVAAPDGPGLRRHLLLATGPTRRRRSRRRWARCDTAVRSGKALYAGISSYSPERHREAAAILADLGTPLLIHQPSYSMLNRWIETRGCSTRSRTSASAASPSPRWPRACSPTSTWTASPRARARARTSRCRRDLLTDEALSHVRALNEHRRSGAGRRLAQLALAWALRDPRVTSVLIGASSVGQLEENVGALANLDVHRRRAAPRSTSTPSTPASTCGRRPAPARSEAGTFGPS